MWYSLSTVKKIFNASPFEVWQHVTMLIFSIVFWIWTSLSSSHSTMSLFLFVLNVSFIQIIYIYTQFYQTYVFTDTIQSYRYIQKTQWKHEEREEVDLSRNFRSQCLSTFPNPISSLCHISSTYPFQVSSIVSKTLISRLIYSIVSYLRPSHCAKSKIVNTTCKFLISLQSIFLTDSQ